MLSFTNSESWIVLSDIEQQIKAKIEAIGTPLKDWDINIYRGVLTGFNEAFIINGEKKDEILANCKDDVERKKTDELIRPILKGCNIKRYSYVFADLYLITTFPSLKIDIERYPAVKKFLEGFKPKLEQTGNLLTDLEKKQILKYAQEQGINIKDKDLHKSRKKTSNKWFETQDSISYWEDFYKQKIAWVSVGETYYSCIDSGMFLLDTNYFFSTDSPEYLLGVLNSKLITYWINSEDTPIGSGGAYRHYKYNLERLSIPKDENCMIAKLVKKLLYKIDTNILKEIDFIVYSLYGLTEKEINFIENMSI